MNRLPGRAGPIDRRKFLVAGGATAAVAAVSGVGGQILTNRRFNANASRAAVKLAADHRPRDTTCTWT